MDLVNPDPWLTRRDVAARLRVQEKTVANWASKGTGPKYTRLGGTGPVRYRLSDVVAFENSSSAA